MGVTFAVRGTSFTTAYHSTGPAVGFTTNTANVTVGVDAGALSGSLIDLTNTTANSGIIFNGYGNAGESRAFSVLLRMKANYTGTPGANRSLFMLGGPLNTGPIIEFWHNTSGNILVFAKNETNGTALNSASFGSWSPTSGTYYDLVFTWDGTTSANAVKFYVDGTGLTSNTAAVALTSSWKSSYFNPITIGANFAVGTCSYKLDEFVIWDSVINPSSVTLVSGSGALNGASRVSLVDCTNIDGSSYTDPGIANVKTGTSYTYAGVSQSGTYDGSDRWTDPGVSNVRTAIAYKANSGSNNRTGTLTLPSVNDVRSGTTFDAGTKTGLLDLPATTDVKAGVQYDQTTKTGTLSTGGASSAEIVAALIPFLPD